MSIKSYTYHVIFYCTILYACSKSDPGTSQPPTPPTPPIPGTPQLPVYGGLDTLGSWSVVSSFDKITHKFGSISFPTKVAGYITNNYYDNVVKLISTKDAGITWSAPAPFGSINRIQFLTPLVGWAYRPNIPGWNLSQTINGAETFYNRFQSKYIYSLVKNICFINDTIAYALTQQGEFLKIKNPLQVANSVITSNQVSIGQNVNDVSFADLRNGWCVTENDGLGSGGRIYNTSDSGKTWQQQLAISNEYLSSVVFADINNGWVSTNGNHNFIYRTSNGGQTWNKVIITKADNSRVSTAKMIFLNSLTGYMISTNEILKTSDGGLTWNRSLKTGPDGIVDFCFTKPDMLWAISPSRIFKLTL